MNIEKFKILQEKNNTYSNYNIPNYWIDVIGKNKYVFLLFILNRWAKYGPKITKYSSIEEGTGLSSRTVNSYINIFRDSGIIEVEKSRKGKTTFSKIIIDENMFHSMDEIIFHLSCVGDKYKRNEKIIKNIKSKEIIIKNKNINKEKITYILEKKYRIFMNYIEIKSNESCRCLHGEMRCRSLQSEKMGYSPKYAEIIEDMQIIAERKADHCRAKENDADVCSLKQKIAPKNRKNCIKDAEIIEDMQMFAVRNADVCSLKNHRYLLERYEIIGDFGRLARANINNIYNRHIKKYLLRKYETSGKAARSSLGKKYDGLENPNKRKEVSDFSQNNMYYMGNKTPINKENSTPIQKEFKEQKNEIDHAKYEAESQSSLIEIKKMKNEAYRKMKGFVANLKSKSEIKNDIPKMSKTILEKVGKKKPIVKYMENEKFVDFWNELTKAHPKSPKCKKFITKEGKEIPTKGFQMVLSFFHELKSGKLFTSSKRFMFTSEYLGTRGLIEIASRKKINDNTIFQWIHRAIQIYDKRFAKNLPTSFPQFLYNEFGKYSKENSTGISLFLEQVLKEDKSKLFERAETMYNSLDSELQDALEEYIVPALNKLRGRGQDEEPEYGEIIDLCNSIQMAYELYNKKYKKLIENKSQLKGMTYGGSFKGFMSAFADQIEQMTWKDIPIAVLFNPSGKYFGEYLSIF